MQPPPAATRAAPAPRPPVAAPPAAARPAETRKVTVQAGDTAGKIAAANKPANVSLDQMLVSLYRGNPQAFIDNNMNRLKAGVVLKVPGSDKLGEQVIGHRENHALQREQVVAGVRASGRLGDSQRRPGGAVGLREPRR